MGKEACLTADVHFITRLNPWVSMHVNYYDSIRHTEPLITRDVLRIVDRAGAECAGLPFAVKTGSSLSGKLALETPPGEDISTNSVYKLKDIVRYTVLASNKDFTDVAKNVMSSFSKAGYELFQVKNRFIDPIQTTGYRGLHLNFVFPYGIKIEVQCHTPDTFRTKMMVHDLYKETQNPCLSETRRDGYCRLMRSYYEQTRPVPHVEELPSISIHPCDVPDISVSVIKDAQNLQESFAVCQDGKELLSGCEYKDANGHMTSALSFADSPCTQILSQIGPHVHGLVCYEKTALNRENIELLLSEQSGPSYSQSR